MIIITGIESDFPMLKIRLATPDDRDAIIAINRLSWQQAYQAIFTPEEIAQLFQGEIKQRGSWLSKRKERLGVFVADDNGTLLGFIGMASLLEDKAAEITTFYILPDEQGKGLGKQLWERALKHLCEGGYTAIWVWVLEKAKARQFYEGRGCVEKARGIYSVGSHEEETIGYFMDLELSSDESD
jgi:GNAT superfamily N-acetyltransferase